MKLIRMNILKNRTVITAIKVVVLICNDSEDTICLEDDNIYIRIDNVIKSTNSTKRKCEC